MEAITGGVTLSKDKGLTASVPIGGKQVGLINDLIEERDGVDGVRRRTSSIVWERRVGVRHVRGVVGGVEVDTVPTRWEEDLGANTVGAVYGRQSWTLRNGLGTVVVEANKRNGSSSGGASVVSGEGVASKHSETLWECMELLNGAVGKSAGTLPEDDVSD